MPKRSLNTKKELEIVLHNENIAICLIAETHLTSSTFINFKNYYTYCTNHPANAVRGGSAIIIRKHLKHEEEDKLQMEEFQATTIRLHTITENLLLTSLYSPPRHQVK